MDCLKTDGPIIKDKYQSAANEIRPSGPGQFNEDNESILKSFGDFGLDTGRMSKLSKRSIKAT